MKRLRCAIYTRVSTEHGLEQEFNSLHAQREAAEAYIKSQTHEGWHLVRGTYDDAGFSGGSMARPALQQLLDAVRQSRIDVIVVYKVDRLTRSLADFARLVELFDAPGVSFVSVTQAFNTTTSMGRLTLNVLLSFAQFEREVTSERIRDKIAASKKRGLWVGGMIPLGYESRNKVLWVVEHEAETVRLIFRLYLELGSLGALLVDLRQRGIVTKVRPLANGRTIGRIAFTRGPLAYLLRNRFYIGEIVYRDATCPAAHPPILERDLFEAVQTKLDAQRVATTARRKASAARLLGKLYDDRGNRMSPSHAAKRGVRYRYYISTALTQGRPEEAGSIKRVAAPELESTIMSATRAAIPDSQDLHDHALIARHLARADIGQDSITIHLAEPQDPASNQDPVITGPIVIPFRRRPGRVRREVIRQPEQVTAKPIRSKARVTLLRAIAQSRSWIDEILAGDADLDTIAVRAGTSARQVRRAISLAILAPDIVQAAIEGTLPRNIGVTTLFEPTLLCAEQRSAFGLAPT